MASLDLCVAGEAKGEAYGEISEARCHCPKQVHSGYGKCTRTRICRKYYCSVLFPLYLEVDDSQSARDSAESTTASQSARDSAESTIDSRVDDACSEILNSLTEGMEQLSLSKGI